MRRAVGKGSVGSHAGEGGEKTNRRGRLDRPGIFRGRASEEPRKPLRGGKGLNPLPTERRNNIVGNRHWGRSRPQVMQFESSPGQNGKAIEDPQLRESLRPA